MFFFGYSNYLTGRELFLKSVVVVVSQYQHQKGHTVPKQVIMIAMSIQVATVQVLHCVRAIRCQAKSEQNVRQDLIPRGATWRLLSCTPFLKSVYELLRKSLAYMYQSLVHHYILKADLATSIERWYRKLLAHL